MSKSITQSKLALRGWQISLLVVILAAWHFFTLDPKVAFFFGQPLEVVKVIWAWFVTNGDIYLHLGVTLSETLLAFAIGTIAGLACGLWLGLSPRAAACAAASKPASSRPGTTPTTSSSERVTVQASPTLSKVTVADTCT